MTKRQPSSTEINTMTDEVSEDDWTSEYQEIYYDPKTHKFVYLSEEDASVLLGVPIFGD